MKLEYKELLNIINEALEKLYRIKKLPIGVVSSDMPMTSNVWMTIKCIDNKLATHFLKNSIKDSEGRKFFYVSLSPDLWEDTKTQQVDLAANVPNNISEKEKIVLRIAYTIFAAYNGHIVLVYNQLRTKDMLVGTWNVAKAWYDKL